MSSSSGPKTRTELGHVGGFGSSAATASSSSAAGATESSPAAASSPSSATGGAVSSPSSATGGAESSPSSEGASEHVRMSQHASHASVEDQRVTSLAQPAFASPDAQTNGLSSEHCSHAQTSELHVPLQSDDAALPAVALLPRMKDAEPLETHSERTIALENSMVAVRRPGNRPGRVWRARRLAEGQATDKTHVQETQTGGDMSRSQHST